MNTGELKAIHLYASQVRETAEAVLAGLPPAADAGLRTDLEKILKHAIETEKVAGSPVRIGVVGRFNAGKSLVIGGLVGYADGVPVKPIPTTGNVTALSFRASTEPEEVHTTRFEKFVVDFMNKDTAVECLKELLAEAERLAVQGRLPKPLTDGLAAFKPDDKGTLTGLDAWCRQAWMESRSFALMRFLLRELVWFTRAYLACGDALCGGPASFAIDGATAEEGLTLDIPESVAGLQFEQLPPPPPGLSSPPEKATPAFLRGVFPLIARLRVEVVIARGVWDLTSLRDPNDFVLLDFPGLGAASSGARDRFLCRRELESVQTILLLLSSEEPGGGGAREWDDIFAPLAKKKADFADCILVGVNKFDLLNLTEAQRTWVRDAARLAGGSDEPPSWDDEPAAKLTEAELFGKIETLKAAVNVAEGVVPAERRDRVVLLSPVVYLNKLAAGGVPAVASPRFMPQLQRDGEGAAAAAEFWGTVARTLQADPAAKKDGLTQWLTQFATDGGISALRGLLASHVKMHGLSQLVREADASARGLRDAIAALAKRLPAPASATDVLTDPDRLQAVKEAVRRLSEHFRSESTQVRRQGLVLTIDRDGHSRPLSERIDEEVISRIYDWPQWENLLSAVNRGYVAEGRPGGREGGKATGEEEVGWGDGGDDAAGDDDFPVRSDDFFPPFQATLADLQSFIRKQVEAGIDEWLKRLGGSVERERGLLAKVLASDAVAGELKRLKVGGKKGDLIGMLKAAAEPTRLKARLLRESDFAGDQDAARLFPQPRRTDTDPGRTYGWAKTLREHADPAFRPDQNLSHQAQVARLRDEFVTILCQEANQLVSVTLKRVEGRVRQDLSDLSQQIARLDGHDTALRAMARGDAPAAAAAAKSAAPDALTTARDLAAIPWPLA